MAFNFSEEEINNMYGMYQSVLQDVQEQTQNVAQRITEKAGELKYHPVVELSKESVTYYNEELKNAVLKAMQEWQEGDSSFSKIMDKMSAGEDAKARSKELENQIVDEIESWKPIDTSGLESIYTTNWHCQVSDFQVIKEIIQSFLDGIEEELSSYATKLEDKKEENTIYVSIEPVILQTITIVSEGFKAGINESFTTLSQEFETKEQEAMTMGASAAESVAQKSQSFVSSGAEALKAKVKTILE